MRDLRLAPFQVGDLVLAGRFEHAVAGVPIRLQRDIVEIAMRQAAQRRRGMVLEMQAAPAPARGAGPGVAVSQGVSMSI